MFQAKGAFTNGCVDGMVPLKRLGNGAGTIRFALKCQSTLPLRHLSVVKQSLLALQMTRNLVTESWVLGYVQSPIVLQETTRDMYFVRKLDEGVDLCKCQRPQLLSWY